jgi:hypothetical protein
MICPLCQQPVAFRLLPTATVTTQHVPRLRHAVRVVLAMPDGQPLEPICPTCFQSAVDGASRLIKGFCA